MRKYAYLSTREHANMYWWAINAGARERVACAGGGGGLRSALLPAQRRDQRGRLPQRGSAGAKAARLLMVPP